MSKDVWTYICTFTYIHTYIHTYMPVAVTNHRYISIAALEYLRPWEVTAVYP